MTLDTTKDLFYLVLSIGIGSIAIFLSWGLYEVARLLRQGNDMVKETREKISNVEQAILRMKEKIESSANYFGILAKSGSAIVNMFKSREERREKKRRGKKSELMDEDELDDSSEE